ncbi:MAG: phage antirepressor KilAC domain-containing protein [Methanomicrobiaceae archaeon]|nr:phage antirepressor KilAC domain-containing protein [Methanomicrobiaceae archaeon]
MKSADLKPLIDEYLKTQVTTEKDHSAKNSDNMQVFNFSGHDIRVIMQKEDAWFVAQDVLNILGTNTDNLYKTLDSDEKKTCPVHCTDQVRHLAIVSEAGLYTLLLRSRKPEAKPFRRWVTHEVLPTINRQGYYSTAQNTDGLAEVVEMNQRLEAELKKMRSRYDIAMQLVRNLNNPQPAALKEITNQPDTDNIAVGELARRITQQTGRRINEVNLFKWLRENDYLSDDKRHWNQPTLTAYRQQLFVLEDYPRQLPGGRTMIRHTTRVTGKGQEYFIGIFQRMNSGQKCLTASI